MVRLSWIAVVFVVASGCTSVIYQPKNIRLGTASTATTENVHAAILRAGESRNWIMKDMGGDVVRATYAPRGHEAVVDVSYDTQTFSIAHVSSRDMNEAGGKISHHYNRWVRNLEKDIVFEIGNPERQREWVQDYLRETRPPEGRRAVRRD
jgi:hypothetical protein